MTEHSAACAQINPNRWDSKGDLESRNIYDKTYHMSPDYSYLQRQESVAGESVLYSTRITGLTWTR